jgi:hydroxymethylbilane synthase
MKRKIRIGTRESQLALWQANEVKRLLELKGYDAELVQSEGDIDLVTPLYALGVQGVFTKALDAALLSDRFDIGVHSMKDVPTQLAQGIVQTAVLPRASFKDLFVFKNESKVARKANDHFDKESGIEELAFTIGTSSIRRKAQWLHRFPNTSVDNLRGNVNTRLRKLHESHWDGAIFAAAGLERINLRPENSIELSWMLPAPAQGAIMVVAREGDDYCMEACAHFNSPETALCAKIERDFLKTLMGGCSTPISALAEVKDEQVVFRGNIVMPDGSQKAEVAMMKPITEASELGVEAAQAILTGTGKEIVDKVRNAG